MKRALFAAIVLVWFAVGCSAVSYAPILIDTPAPQGLATVPACSASLPAGARCYVIIQAALWESRSGLQVRSGETYQFVVPPGQAWYDSERRSVPPEGDAGSALMNSAAFLKRHRDSKWFALMVAVLSPEPNVADQAQDLSRETRLVVRTNGELVFYPNDAVAQVGPDDLFYRNNAGRIWVVVENVASPTDTR